MPYQPSRAEDPSLTSLQKLDEEQMSLFFYIELGGGGRGSCENAELNKERLRWGRRAGLGGRLNNGMPIV